MYRPIMKADIAEKFDKVSKRKKKLKLDWAGGLKEYRDQYTALELQKAAVEWMDKSTRR